MTTLSSEIVLRLANHISENLAFRDSVDNLFSYIASLEETNIIIDFLGIKSITGSFAHQYIINKKRKRRINHLLLYFTYKFLTTPR
jgi:hypothetical protein